MGVRARIESYFNRSRPTRQVVGGFLIAIGVVGVAIAIKKSVTRELDLYVILNASRQMLTGADIYATPAPNGAYYLYLPLIAFLFVPLAILPQSFAGLLWTLFCILLIVWSLHEIIKMLAGDAYSAISPFERCAVHVVPVILCADAISSEVGNAQVNCVMLAASVLALKLANRSHDMTAGALLGFATVAKVFTAPLLLSEILFKRFRLVAAGLIGTAAAVLLPASLIGWERNLHYLRYWISNIALYEDLGSHRSGFAGNASIQAVLTRLFIDGPAFFWNGTAYHLNVADLDTATIATIGTFIPFVALLTLIIYFALFRRRTPLISYWGGIALAFCVAPLITPVLERPHFVMLLPAYVYVSWIWLHERIASKLFYASMIAAFILSTFTLKLYVGEFWGNVFWSLGSPTLADVCLIGAIFVAAAAAKDQDLTTAR